MNNYKPSNHGYPIDIDMEDALLAMGFANGIELMEGVMIYVARDPSPAIKCPACGHLNDIAGQCLCDPSNLPTTPAPDKESTDAQ